MKRSVQTFEGKYQVLAVAFGDAGDQVSLASGHSVSLIGQGVSNILWLHDVLLMLECHSLHTWVVSEWDPTSKNIWSHAFLLTVLCEHPCWHAGILCWSRQQHYSVGFAKRSRVHDLERTQ